MTGNKRIVTEKKEPPSVPYAGLLPEVILEAVDSFGRLTSGSLFPLNSYENRVYQIGMEEGGFVIAKFYRPDRLTSDAIREEHTFTRELLEREIPVVAPLANDAGQTLFEHKGYRFALFPRVGGRYPDLEDLDLLFRMGRLLGMIHSTGAVSDFQHRGSIEVGSMGRDAARFLLEKDFVPAEHRHKYEELTDAILNLAESRFQNCSKIPDIRLHGDFHPGNILQQDEKINIVDTDDCRMGPAMQDIWLLLSGNRNQMRTQLSEIIDGYDEFHEFNLNQLQLIEPLRSLRIIHYAGWLARRWNDPAFPMHFPWFNAGSYWDEHIHTLQEQFRQLEEPPINL